MYSGSKVSGIAELANEGAKDSGILHSDAHEGICPDSKVVLGTDKATFQGAASCFLCVDECFLLNLRPIYELARLFWLHVRCYSQCMRHVLPLPLCFSTKNSGFSSLSAQETSDILLEFYT